MTTSEIRKQFKSYFQATNSVQTRTTVTFSLDTIEQAMTVESWREFDTIHS